MASISSPYGAQVISDNTGIVRPTRMPLGISSGQIGNIFKNQPVKLNTTTGTLEAISATTDKLFGFFQGVEYTPTGGRPAESPFWPSGAVYDTTYDMFVYFIPAWLPGLRVQIQADGSVAQTLMGSSFTFTNITAGSTFTGLSACTVGAAGVASGSQGQLTLIEFANSVGDAPGDAYTDLICTVAYPQIGFASQTSIG